MSKPNVTRDDGPTLWAPGPGSPGPPAEMDADLGAALEAAFWQHEVWRNQQKNQQRGQPPRPAVGPHLAARYHQLTRGKPGVGAWPRPLGLILPPRHPGTLGSPPLCVPHTAAHDHQGLAGELPWTCHASRAGVCRGQGGACRGPADPHVEPCPQPGRPCSRQAARGWKATRRPGSGWVLQVQVASCWLAAP